MIRYFLFDLDGTLNDTGPGITGCVQYALDRLGWSPQTEDFLRQFVGPPLLHSFMTFCHMDEPAAQQAIALYRERYWAWGVNQSPLYPGVEGMLRRLGRVAVLGVATSKNEEGAWRILAMRGIEAFFSVVVGDDGSRPSKAEVVGEALRLLGSPPAEQVVMIGDRRFDIEGGRAWGLRTIGAEYGYASPGELKAAGADWLAESVPQLEELCAGLAGGKGAEK